MHQKIGFFFGIGIQLSPAIRTVVNQQDPYKRSAHSALLYLEPIICCKDSYTPACNYIEELEPPWSRAVLDSLIDQLTLVSISTLRSRLNQIDQTFTDEEDDIQRAIVDELFFVYRRGELIGCYLAHVINWVLLHYPIVTIAAIAIELYKELELYRNMIWGDMAR